MIRSGLLLTAGNISVALLGFMRNVLVARLISVENFGIASTFAITMALVEMSSNMALDRLIVQAKDGEAPSLQATIHALQAMRGVAGAALLFAIAGPLATFFGVPDVAWAYQWLAIIPLVRGLAHTDMFRLQRAMRFLPSVVVEFASQFLGTAAAVALALHFGDYRAMLYALIAQQFAYMVISHFAADRRYHWGWDKAVMRKAVVFGWPLLLNGILMFGIFQGDRIIVGGLIGMQELGWFSAAFALTLMPTMVIAKTLATFFMPQLVDVRHDNDEFERLLLVTIQASLVIGVLLAILFAIAGPYFLILLYGNNFRDAASIVTWLAIMQAFRLAKAGPAIGALSVAETTNPLIANIVRFLSLPVAWVIVNYNGDIYTVIILGIIGEFLAFMVSLLLLRKLPLSLTGLVVPCITSICAILLVGADVLTFGADRFSEGTFSWARILASRGDASDVVVDARAS